jgi:hypothetical protein
MVEPKGNLFQDTFNLRNSFLYGCGLIQFFHQFRFCPTALKVSRLDE